MSKRCGNAREGNVYTSLQEIHVNDWTFAQADPSEKLAKLHFYSVQTKSEAGPVELRITVREYASQTGPMAFFAETDEELNKHLVPFRPCGWGNTLFGALSE